MLDLPPMFNAGGDNIWDEPDIVLIYIITALVNGMGLEMGVTLMVRGLVISGTLTSEKDYLDTISNMLAEQVEFEEKGVPVDFKESFKEILNLRSLAEFDVTEFASKMADTNDLDDNDNDDFDFDDMEMPPQVTYLHLKDPVIVAGEPPIQFGDGSNIIIRLRLTMVDGWMLGKITPDVGDFFDFDDDEVKH
jgi:hypothetical protein